MFSRTIRQGLELRLMEERHVDEIYALVDRDRSRLQEWLPWAAETAGPEATRAFVQRALRQFAGNEGLHAGIWQGGRFAGGIGFHKIDWVNRKVEIGYWIGSEFEGRGIVSDTARALVEHAFDGYGLNRVEIHCATGNDRSNAVARRLHFKLDGTLRDGQLLYGRYHDLNVYGLLARDWKAQVQPGGVQ